MKIENSPENGIDSIEVQEQELNSRIFHITLKDMLWVIMFVMGIFATLLLSIISLTTWVLTKNVFFLFSSTFGCVLFIIWGYVNLKNQGELKKPAEH